MSTTPRPLEAKRALVTGAGVRLGQEIALALGRAGARVAVHHHRSASEARRTVEGIQAGGGDAFTVGADLSDPASVEPLFRQLDERFGGLLDVLVNSAGIFERVPAASVTAAQWDRMMAVNARAPFLLAAAARPRLLAAGGGSIVNVTDIAAERPWAGYLHYSASKAALLSLTRGLAVEWAPEIRVNAVAPGAILPPEGSTPEELSRLAAAVPQKRLGDPAEIAQTVLFLLTGPRYITGQVIAVDGGRSVRA